MNDPAKKQKASKEMVPATVPQGRADDGAAVVAVDAAGPAGASSAAGGGGEDEELRQLIDERQARITSRWKARRMVISTLLLALFGGTSLTFAFSPKLRADLEQLVVDLRKGKDDLKSLGSIVETYQEQVDKIGARGEQIDEATAALGVDPESVAEDGDPEMEAEMAELMGDFEDDGKKMELEVVGDGEGRPISGFTKVPAKGAGEVDRPSFGGTPAAMVTKAAGASVPTPARDDAPAKEPAAVVPVESGAEPAAVVPVESGAEPVAVVPAAGPDETLEVALVTPAVAPRPAGNLHAEVNEMLDAGQLADAWAERPVPASAPCKIRSADAPRAMVEQMRKAEAKTSRQANAHRLRPVSMLPVIGASLGTVSASVQVDPTSSVSFRNIRFKAGSDQLLDAASRRQLEIVAEAMKRVEAASFLVEGHTCDLGSKARDKELSERRAAKVVAELVRLGVDRGRLFGLGFGTSNPVAPNTSDDNRQRNVRVMIHRRI